MFKYVVLRIKKEKRSIVRQFHKSQLKITKSVILTNRGPTRQTAELRSVYVITGHSSTVCFYAMDYILGRPSRLATLIDALFTQV